MLMPINHKFTIRVAQAHPTTPSAGKSQKPKVKAISFARQSPPKRELPPISICYSCDLPIKPNGMCGCS